MEGVAAVPARDDSKLCSACLGPLLTICLEDMGSPRMRLDFQSLAQEECNEGDELWDFWRCGVCVCCFFFA